MPGHPISSSSDADVSHTVEEDVAKLEELVKSHDAVFLLMDSRESRWLPTVMGKKWNKVVVNAALGFDSFLVMRHGAGRRRTRSGELEAEGIGEREKKERKKGLGCYYCNDIVAPTDVRPTQSPLFDVSTFFTLILPPFYLIYPTESKR